MSMICLSWLHPSSTCTLPSTKTILYRQVIISLSFHHQPTSARYSQDKPPSTLGLHHHHGLPQFCLL
ncbi:hypothetical protein OWV82_018164 [Melia azedarach]|uniref:Uncharacterized protein n=1 Tax=Melia azedarach TaxID=155640 RepID=A0ACC1X9X4_MELAZ|nr:hypothetical protein OWV82_018164 [Melia azedarach]